MLIDKDLIQLDAEYSTKNQIIEMAAKLLEKHGNLVNLEEYIQAVNAREAEVSTNMGDRIAMPHGLSNSVAVPGLVLIRLKNPVVWDENGEVSIIFQIAVPESGGNLHLKILAKLARKLIYEDYKEKLFNAKSKDELLTLIEEATGELG